MPSPTSSDRTIRDDAKVRHLTVYLLKPSVKSFKDALEKEVDVEPIQLKQGFPFKGVIYRERTKPNPTGWKEFLHEGTDDPLQGLQNQHQSVSPDAEGHGLIQFSHVESKWLVIPDRSGTAYMSVMAIAKLPTEEQNSVSLFIGTGMQVPMLALDGSSSPVLFKAPDFRIVEFPISALDDLNMLKAPCQQIVDRWAEHVKALIKAVV